MMDNWAKKLSNLEFRTKIKEDQAMMLDLLNILTYLSSIATAKVSRDRLFELGGQQDGMTSKYLQKIHLLATKYSYNYVMACKIAADETTNTALRDFLIRFSNALATGEDEATFLRGEVEKIVELYNNKYTSELETLKKWTDGYSALLVSVMMIIAVFLICNMLFSMGNTYFMAAVSGFLFFFVSFLGVYLIYRVTPFEKTTHSLEVRSKEQELARRMSRVILPVLCATSLSLFMLNVESWIICLLIAVVLAPIGIVGVIDANRITTRDRDISTFLKSLGSAAGITGSTLMLALGRLDQRSVGSLEKFVASLHKRLISGVKPNLCWYHFKGETGSDLINRSTTVFLDAIELGGDATEVGAVVGRSALGISLLREKRKLISGGFVSLVIPLHAAMSGVLMFIFQVVVSFNNAIVTMMAENEDAATGAASQMPAGMGFFNFGGAAELAFMSRYILIIILISTIANALASKYADGGSNYKLCFYASLLFFFSAVVLFVIPILAGRLFILEPI